MTHDTSPRARPFVGKNTFNQVLAAMWGPNALDYHTNYLIPRAHWNDSDIRDEAIYFSGMARGLRIGTTQKPSQHVGNDALAEGTRRGCGEPGEQEGVVVKLYAPIVAQNEYNQLPETLPPSPNVEGDVGPPQHTAGNTAADPAQPSTSTRAPTYPELNDLGTDPEIPSLNQNPPHTDVESDRGHMQRKIAARARQLKNKTPAPTAVRLYRSPHSKHEDPPSPPPRDQSSSPPSHSDSSDDGVDTPFTQVERDFDESMENSVEEQEAKGGKQDADGGVWSKKSTGVSWRVRNELRAFERAANRLK